MRAKLMEAQVFVEAPSGVQGLLSAVTGVNSLGTDCWANFAGIQ